MTTAPIDLVLDDDGHLTDHHSWNETLAQHLADSLSITLTETHFVILYAVRDFYATYHHSPSTRPLINHLKATLPEIDNKKLQAMFNTGLVARHINRIAGLPKPPNCL